MYFEGKPICVETCTNYPSLDIAADSGISIPASHDNCVNEFANPVLLPETRCNIQTSTAVCSGSLIAKCQCIFNPLNYCRCPITWVLCVYWQ